MKDRLFYLRKTVLNLSRKKFGDRIGMTDSEIKNIETGITSLKENKIPLICQEYNVNESWLRTGEGSMFREVSRDEELPGSSARYCPTVSQMQNTSSKRI